MGQSIEFLQSVAKHPLQDVNELFRYPNNYAMVYAMSDHFAVICDI